MSALNACIVHEPSLHDTAFICLNVCLLKKIGTTDTYTDSPNPNTDAHIQTEQEKILLLIGPIDNVRLISPTLTHHRFIYHSIFTYTNVNACPIYIIVSAGSC